MAESFMLSYNNFTTFVGLVDDGCSIENLTVPGQCKVQVLGGNHSREAIQAIRKRDEFKDAEEFQFVYMDIYSNLTKEQAWYLGYSHNEIHSNSKEMSFMEKVTFFRKALESCQSRCEGANQKKISQQWRSDLAAVLNKTLIKCISKKQDVFFHTQQFGDVFDDKTERPIAFISKSLSKAEQNYAQIDKEALAIYWAVKKFYPYLFGRNFTLVTDHQPLTSIFNPSKSLTVTSASRLQRYAMFLSEFTYSIIYKNTKHHTNADALSRLPLKCENDKDFDAVDVFHTTQIETLPMTSETVANATRRDTVLSQVLLRVQGGWTEGENDKSLSSFYNRRHELSLHQNCLMWGIRVIIPSTLKQQVLELLHSSHPGVVKMKSLARSYVWWPGIDSDIERLAKECAGCQKQQNNPGTVYVHPWEWPSAPWQRVHIDFAGPFLDQNFFILVDAHSKWPEVIPMKRITTARTIEILRTIFSRNGIPEQIVSDNGPQFTSAEFGQFMKNNAIRHYKSAPYHPATNGLAERFVQTFERSIKSMKHDSMSLNKKIANFLLQYRNTPHTTTNESPAKLFVGRQLRSRLDLIRPNIQGKVDRANMNSAFGKKGKPVPSFKPGDHVIVRDYRGNKWINGTIESLLGPLNCTVKTDFGSLWKRHVDQIRKTECRNKTEFSETRYDERVPVTPCTISVPCNDTVSIGNDHNNVSESVSADIESEWTDHNAEIKRYPTRERKAPKRLIEEM
ncbi:hypothetical protein FSP39_016945 [Pinctada imbricata]|uniref:Integrase catalytic domain-containing protein n=1 Tax=Pinctada imbricata TaxID=66713 RepID=A0AA88Y4Y6_PINIB|nr:hypothetical protein FSP39_016945 [Pinctada imbricata]